MADILNTLGSMFSLILVTVLGYIAARCGFINSEIRPKLSGLIFNITLPCSILASVGKVDSSAGAEQIMWSFILGAAMFFVMLAAGFIASLVVGAPRSQRHLYLFTSFLTNTGFIGFAVLEALFGGGSVFLGSIFIALGNIFLYSIGITILKSGGREKGSGKRIIDVRAMLKDMFNVPLVASVIAMIVFFTGVPLPGPVAQAASMTGGITSPLAMMLVGLSVADADLKSVLTEWRIWGFTLVRFLVIPAIAYVVLAPIVPAELALGVFIVMLAMPTGSMAAPIAATYGQETEMPTRATIISTIASFVIVPVLMVLMGTL